MVADNEAGAYVEWDSMAVRTRRNRTTCQVPGQEDDETTGAEDDWHPEGGNFAQSSAGQHVVGGAGCSISDPDLAVDDGPVDGEADSESEKMIVDVPMLPVFSSAHNIFTDRRLSLGLSNLQSSYRTNGGEVRSADSGQAYRSTWRTDGQPGQPV